MLETDLAHHFTSLAKFKDVLAEKRERAQSDVNVVSDVMKSPDGRMMVMRMCIACADISHSSKPWALHDAWSKRVLQEFFLQGEAEASKGLAISSLCDRAKVDVWKSQLGFIDFLALPQFKVWCDFLGQEKVTKDMIGNTENNRAQWVQLQSENAPQGEYKDRALLEEMTMHILKD